jgi:hypothetical protein
MSTKILNLAKGYRTTPGNKAFNDFMDSYRDRYFDCARQVAVLKATDPIANATLTQYIVERQLINMMMVEWCHNGGSFQHKKRKLTPKEAFPQIMYKFRSYCTHSSIRAFTRSSAIKVAARTGTANLPDSSQELMAMGLAIEGHQSTTDIPATGSGIKTTAKKRATPRKTTTKKNALQERW